MQAHENLRNLLRRSRLLLTSGTPGSGWTPGWPPLWTRPSTHSDVLHHHDQSKTTITNTKVVVIPTEQHNAIMVNLIPYWRWQLVFFGFSWPILRCWGRSDINIKDWHESSLCYLKYWFSTQPPHLDLDQKWNWLWSFIFYQTRADHWLCLSLIHSRTH